MKKYNFTTRVLHTPYAKKDAHGALNFPIYSAAAFGFESAEETEMAFRGQTPSHVYSRISNPTVEYFQNRVQSITDAATVTALASGMAAISSVFLTISKTGSNIITSKNLFGNTFSFFNATLREFGVEVRFVDMNNAAQIKENIDEHTVALFFETITNPQIEVLDVNALSAIAKAHHIALIADTTLTPPYIFDAKAHGVNIEMVSSTKYISGGATSLGGLIIDYGTFDWSSNSKLKDDAKKYNELAFSTRLNKEIYRNLGACMSPQTAFLQTVGLETLALRIDRSCANTLAVAEFLQKQEKIKAVNYPGLQSSPFYKVAKAQFGNKCGGVLTFDLESKEQCFKLLNAFSLIKRATNLNDNKTLAIHPASTIYWEFTPQQKEEASIRETMVRLAVGIEEVEDIIDDLKTALQQI